MPTTSKRPFDPERRKRGQGTIRWHAASGRWEAQLPASVDRRQHSEYFAGDHQGYREANDWIRDQLERHRRGLDVEAGRERVNDYLDRWFDRLADDPDVGWSTSTRRTYEWAIATVDFGRTTLAELRRDAVDDELARLARAGIAPKSRQLIRTVLRAAFERLIDDDVLAQNPVRPAPRPTTRQRRAQAKRPRPLVWSEDDARRFLQTANAHSPWPALWWLALRLGLRNGQLRGLRWSDVYLDDRVLIVRISRHDHLDEDGPNKNGEDLVIQLDDGLMALFEHERRRRRVATERIFVDRDGRPLRGYQVRHELQRLRELASVAPIGKPHNLRHTAASLMLANGYPITAVAAILGHANSNTTLQIYSHWVPDTPIDRPRTMDEILPFEPPSERTDRQRAPAQPPSAVRSAVGRPSTILVRRRSPANETLTDLLHTSDVALATV